jgi:hypothetical protein
MASSQQTLADLQNLTTLYRQGHHSPIIERTVEKMVAFERDRARQEAAEIDPKLQTYEQRHPMNSEDFYRLPGLPNFLHHVHTDDQSAIPGHPLSILDLIGVLEKELTAE